MHVPTCLFLIAAALAASAPVSAAPAVPDRVTFTARLVNNDVPFEGDVQIKVSLFRGATGGVPVWTETHAATADAGLVALVLGGQQPLDAAVVDGGALHLEIIVDDTILSPRLPIGSVPYALMADRAATAAKLGDLGADAFQRTVTSTCAPGASIRAIDATGGVVCEPDDDTTYTFGTGLTTAGTAVSVDTDVVQRRVAPCAAGSSIRAIAADGSVTCEVDDNTSVTTGFGLTLSSSNQISVDTNAIQRRVGSCPAGTSIRSVAADGSVTCETDTVIVYSATCATNQFVTALSSTGTVTCGGLSNELLTARSVLGGSASDTTTTPRAFCGLTRISSNSSRPDCQLSVSAGGIWTLTADAPGTTTGEVTCEARCF